MLRKSSTIVSPFPILTPIPTSTLKLPHQKEMTQLLQSTVLLLTLLLRHVLCTEGRIQCNLPGRVTLCVQCRLRAERAAVCVPIHCLVCSCFMGCTAVSRCLCTHCCLFRPWKQHCVSVGAGVALQTLWAGVAMVMVTVVVWSTVLGLVVELAPW
jgi:hypothetical protein